MADGAPSGGTGGVAPSPAPGSQGAPAGGQGGGNTAESGRQSQGSGTSSGVAADAAPGNQADARPRQAGQVRPIPPGKEPPPKPGKKSLPGVITRDSAEELFGGKLVHADSYGRFHDETGRFISSTGSEGAHGTQQGEGRPPLPAGANDQKETAQQKPAEQTPAELSREYKFNGKAYKTLQEAEQVHATLVGMHKSNLQRISDLESRHTEWRDATFQWRDAYEALQREVAELRGGRAPAQAGNAGAAAGSSGQAGAGNQGAAASGLPSVDQLLGDIDFDAFENVALNGPDGLKGAGRHLATAVLKAVGDKLVPALRAQLQQEVAPLHAERQESAVLDAADQTIEAMGSLKTVTGESAFPELSDSNELEAIGRVWRESGRDPARVLESGAGLLEALALYRLLKGLPTGAAAQALATSTPPTNGAGSTPPPAAGPAASVDGGSAPSIPPNAGRQDSRLSPSENRLASALLQVGTNLRDKNLGFSRNRAGMPEL